MVGPAAKREAVAHLRGVLEMSERRACNIVAVDRKMIRYRSRRPPDTEQAFEARLQALTRINRKLTQSDWSGLSLKEIVRQELEPFVARALIEGIDLTLSPQHAQNLSLVLHELATNAAKYGALSNATGKIGVFWTVASDDKNKILKFRWQERGGPPVVSPTHRGFGTTLLNAAFAGVRFDYAAEGVSCEFEIPLGSQHSSSTIDIE
jgi:two-component sensor histidine kinase